MTHTGTNSHSYSERIALRPTEAAKLIGVSRSKIYAMIRMPGFPCRQVDGRFLIPRRALEQWVEGKMDA